MKRFRSLSLFLAILQTFIFSAPAHANPSFSHTEAGSVRIEENGSVYDIYSADRSIGAFNSFGNAAGETINSIQANASDTALFRVIGNDPSVFYGALNANSRIFLINHNGIVFAEGSQIDAAGLTASTLDMANGDFLSGRYLFNRVNDAGAAGYILNQGRLVAQNGGYIALLGGAVENRGTIEAEGGSVALAAGDSMRFSLDGRGLVSVEVDGDVHEPVYDLQGNRINDAIRNSGVIAANGGRVVLSARAAEEVFDNSINHSGAIEAKSASVVNGEVLLDGGNDGVVRVSGSVDASGKDAGETGGSVKILGEKVGLIGGAKIDVSGDAGGGEVLVGGDAHGGNGVPTADYVFMGSDAEIDADALGSGDGGKIILWGDEASRVYGTLHARGAGSGDGGFVETSGRYLEVTRAVDVSSAGGAAGTWLLDPEDITITNAGGGAPANVTQSGSGDPGPILFAPTAADTPTLVDVAAINTALNNGSNVTVNTASAGTATTGTITVSQAIAKTADGGSADGSVLTLIANDGIVVNANISSTTGTLGVVFTATGAVLVNADITTNGGSFQSTGTTFGLTAGSTVSTGGAAATVNHTGAVTLTGNITTAAGSSTITGSSVSLADGSVQATTGGATITASSGALTAAGATNATAEITAGGNVTLSARSFGTTTNHLEIDGDASANSTLSLTNTSTAASDSFIDVLTDEFSAVTIAHNDAEANLTLDLSGADIVTVTGAAATSTLNAQLAATEGALTYSLTELQTILVDDMQMGAANATVTSAGSVSVETINTTGSASITATGGSVTDGNAGAVNVVAGTLTAAAATGIDLDTTVTNLTATTSGTGSILIDETNGLNVTNVSATNGSVTLVTGGSMAITTVAAAGGTATLTATGDITDNNAGAVNVTGNSLVATATTGIDLDTTVASLTATTSGAGNINLDETNGANVLNVNAANGNATVTSSTGNLAVTTVSAAGNTVTLTSTAGSITDANAAAVNVTGTSLVATAGTGIDLDTTVTNLTASVTGTGSAILDETDGANVLNGAAANGSVTVTTAAGNLAVTTVTATGGTATLTATAGSITDANAAAVNVTGSSLVTTSATGVDLDTNVSAISATVTGAGNINFAESNDVNLQNLTTANGSITVTAAGATIANSVTSQTDADANDITISTSTGDLFVGQINAGRTAGDITLTATTGALRTNSGGTNLIGDQVSLTSQGDIGSAAAPMTYSANNLNFNITGAGTAFLVSFSNGVLDTSLSSGNLLFSAVGDVTVRHGDAFAGSIDLTAGGSIYAENPDVVLTALNGIRLVAGGTIGTASTPLKVYSINGSPIFLSAGGEDKGVSIHLEGSTPREDVHFLNSPPPGLAIYNAALVGGAGLDESLQSTVPLVTESLPLSEAGFASRHPEYSGFAAEIFEGVPAYGRQLLRVETAEAPLESSLYL